MFDDFGPLLAGILADQFGSYEFGFTLLAILSGLGSIFFLVARRPTPPALEDAQHGPDRVGA